MHAVCFTTCIEVLPEVLHTGNDPKSCTWGIGLEKAERRSVMVPPSRSGSWASGEFAQRSGIVAIWQQAVKRKAAVYLDRESDSLHRLPSLTSPPPPQLP